VVVTQHTFAQRYITNFPRSGSKQTKTLLRAGNIAIIPVLGPTDQIDLEQSNAWEQCSITSWENMATHVVGDNQVPLPPSLRRHRQHKNNFEQFLELEVAHHDAFKERVARRRLKVASPCGDQHITQVETSTVLRKTCQDLSPVNSHISSACSPKSISFNESDHILPGFLEF